MGESKAVGRRFLSIILRWTWLIIAASLLAMLITYLFSKDKPLTYQAQSLLIVGPGIDSPNPDLNTLRAGSQLMLTYAEMPTTEPFLRGIINKLGLNIDVEPLSEMIEIKANTETQVVSVIVTSENPDLAVAIANQTADDLVQLSPSGSNNPFDPTRDQIRQQTLVVEASIVDTIARIDQIDDDLKSVNELEAQSLTGDSSLIFDPEKQLEQLELDYQNAIIDPNNKRQASLDTLELHLIPNSTARMDKLQEELKLVGNISIQRLIIDQLTKERDHLSSLQNMVVELKRLTGGQTLEEMVMSSEARVKQFEDEILNPSIDLDTHRLLISDLEADRGVLSELRQTALTREQTFLELIAQERSRISEIQQYRVESRGVLADQLQQERKSLDDSYNTVALLYSQLEKSTTNQVKIIERASSAVVVGPGLLLILALSGVTGLILSGVTILAIEFFSDRVQSPADLEDLTGKPVLGVVERTRFMGRATSDSLILERLPDSSAADRYRLVGTKLRFAKNSNSWQSAILIPSQSDDDIAEVAANLAIVMAQAGNRTILVDANLHQPRIHQLFNIPESEGLSDFLVSPNQKPHLISLDNHPGLCLLTAGSIYGSPYELLTTGRILDLLTYVQLKSDIFLISAPAPTYAETLFLASRLDMVILIVNTNQTSQNDVKFTQESLQSVGIQVTSSILCDNYRTQLFSMRYLLNRRDLTRSTPVEAKSTLPPTVTQTKEGNPVSKPLR
jgi:polysaccharide biosynthesis transport protein